MSTVPQPLDQSAGERALACLIHGAHSASADQLCEVVAGAAAELGARHVDLLVVDHGQTQLVALDGGRRHLAIDGTVAGRAFRQMLAQTVLQAGGERLWVPLIDGLERLGVLGLTFDRLDESARARSQHLASLTAELIITKGLVGDGIHQASRLEPMTLAAEMQWSLMPPLTAGTSTVAVAAMLEPAYEVGGDLVDYALGVDRAHLAVFDSVGHGVQASLLTALAVGSYRNSRRAGQTLPDTMRAVEDAVAAQFRCRLFVTAIFADLDLRTGRLSWVNAGHPPPLLLRERHVVKELDGRSAVPLGLGLNDDPFTVHEEHLQRGDRILLYTDGIVDARPPDGQLFGVNRLIEFILQAEAAQEPIPETMRRLSRALLTHQHGRLRDDATLMLVEWCTDTGLALAERATGTSSS